MAAEVLTAGGLRRIANQLQTLSELTETLTYRLLELEEKVAATGLSLETLASQDSAEAAQLSDETELRLEETEQRLAGLEALLAGLQPLTRHRQDAPLAPEPHFPEEDFEQPFLDEQELAGHQSAVHDHQVGLDDGLDDDERLIA